MYREKKKTKIIDISFGRLFFVSPGMEHCETIYLFNFYKIYPRDLEKKMPRYFFFEIDQLFRNIFLAMRKK